MKAISGTFTNLFTERLVLRQLNLQDDNEIFFLRSDERVLKYLAITPANNLEDARAFIHKINGIADICLKNESKLIGTICIWNFPKKKIKLRSGIHCIRISRDGD